MGMFSFIKEAGAKIFGTSSANASDESVAKVKAHLEQYQFGVEGFDVVVEDGKATLTGTVADAATKEKIILVVGNLDGIGEVDDQMTISEQAEAAPEPRFYTVKSGDNLSKIAKEFYGSANKYPVIFEANKPMLTHPDKIYPGQTLRIPAE
ncbi:MAG: peptidoglycan-binding protein LysM [Oleibacter sp.]|nr:peptidoglycan-binding protein LysM [Thalassolituus sp.]